MARMGVVAAENGPEVPLYIPGRGARFVTVEGDPILPSDVAPELAKIDPALKIEFIRGFGGTNRWVLKKMWRQNDKRWARVQSGELPREMAFDVEHEFPRDCPTDAMVSYVTARYGDRANPGDHKVEAQRIVDAAMKRQQDIMESQTDDMVEQGTQRFLDDTDHQRRLRGGDSTESAHAMVGGYDGPKRLL